MYSTSPSVTSNKPSWAFNIADGSPRSKSTLQNYRIPYPRSQADENTARQQFVCARAFLVITNILFFVVGFASIITSITAAAKPETCEMCHSVLNPLLVLGLVTSFIAALGIYGALSNSYKMLLVYVTLVAFLFMVQIVVFFWSLCGRVNFQRRMHTVFRDKMRHQPHQLTELLDLVQQRLPCCGVDGPLDYHSVGLQLPLSCCSPSGGAPCTIQTLPTISSTPTPQLNATVAAANTTATSDESTAVNTSTAAPAIAMALPEEPSPESEETSPEAGKTSPKAGKTSPEAEETSPNAGKTSPKAEQTSTKAGKTSSKAEETSTKAEETWSEAEETSTEAGETSTEAEETSPEAETERPSKVRPKRSVTDPAGVTPGPNDVTAWPAEGTPGNGSLIIMNATEVLTGNFSVNGTTEVSLEELFSNRTNLTGGPESWDIHHVKKHGCYSVLWEEVDRHHGCMVGITLAAAAVLSLQLVVLCTAHHVARGDFIRQE